MKQNTLSRQEKTQAKKIRILESAIHEFLSHGFDNTTVENIAKHAGVAKGSIYTYFSNKTELFEESIRYSMAPRRIAIHEYLLHSEHKDCKELFSDLLKYMLSLPDFSRHTEILRLVISEGLKHPHLVRFYKDDIILPSLTLIAEKIKGSEKTGELLNNDVLKNPQIIVSPLILSVVWNGLFGQESPIDPLTLFQLQLELIFKSN